MRLFFFIFEPHCPFCEKLVSTFSICSDCSAWPEIKDKENHGWISSCYELTPQGRSLLHSIKYDSCFERLRLLLPFLPDSIPWNQDKDLVLIPVPLSKERFFERGFNQSEWLAKKMSERTHFKLDTRNLTKIQETKPQSTLSGPERRKNLRGVFHWNPNQLVPERVCLIDDVLTTGSTLEACRATLIKAGAKEVFAWTLFETTTNVFNGT